MTGGGKRPPRLTIDRHESGFPVAQELMTMAVDAQQAEKHLAGMPSETELKDRMVRQIVGEQTIPTALQFALSQRYYYEALAAGGMFWARNDPDAQWIEDLGTRRHFLVHWAVWDTQVNLPVVYLLDLEDSGKKPLPNDAYRWPEAQAALMAQSVGGLKLLTIATGFDKDFADLHPKRLRRIILGPMYSANFTLQSGPISKVLEGAKAPEGDGLGAGLDGRGPDLGPRGRGEGRLVLHRPVRQVYKLDPVVGAESWGHAAGPDDHFAREALSGVGGAGSEGAAGLAEVRCGGRGAVDSDVVTWGYPRGAAPDPGIFLNGTSVLKYERALSKR